MTGKKKDYVLAKVIGAGIGRALIGVEYGMGAWIVLHLLGRPW